MSMFFWGDSDNARNIDLVDWNNLTMPFDKGGLEIVSLEDLNVALIAKWTYRYANERIVSGEVL